MTARPTFGFNPSSTSIRDAYSNMLGLNHDYSRVSDGDGSPDELGDKATSGFTRQSQQSWLLSQRTGTILVAVLSTVVAILCSIILVSDHKSPVSAVSTIEPVTSEPVTSESSTKTQDLDIQHCGGTPAEARELGCVYDVMMQLWTPQQCYDKVLTEKYLANNNWTWWADSNAERAMSDEEMALGEHDVVYVAQDYHVKHCIFAWEKVIRALRTQEPLIEELISYDHIIHCRDHTLLPAMDASKHIRGVVAPTGYTHCAPYDVWVQALPENQHSSID